MSLKNLFLTISLITAYNAGACDRDSKQESSSYALELLCNNCDKYILTLAGNKLKKDVFLWEAIIKPQWFKASSDISKFLPVSSLPAIACGSCNEICFKPILYKIDDSSKAAYKIAAARVCSQKK